MKTVTSVAFALSLVVAQLAAAQATARPEPELRCQGQEEGVGCWLELANRPGCYIWKEYLRYLSGAEGALWDGRCVRWRDGYAVASGFGQLRFREPGDSAFEDRDGYLRGRYVGEGELREGKKDGRWTDKRPDRIFETGTYVAGKRHGRWSLGFAGGGMSETDEGPYVDDKKHGDWVERFAEPGLLEIVSAGPYVDDKKHGSWTIRSTDGRMEAGPYVDGKRHGLWAIRSADGGMEAGPYVDGKKEGPWTIRSAEGRIESGLYVDDEKDGLWTVRLANGLAFWELCYAKGLEVDTC